MKVCAVIPAHNEETTIGVLVKKLRKFVDQVIIVANGCSDNTTLVAKKAGAKTIVIREKGFDHSLNVGIKKALKEGVDVIITLDADLEHDPKHIPVMLKMLKKFDVVVGRRKELPRVSERIAAMLLRSPDPFSGFKAMKRKVAKEIPFYTGKETYGCGFLLRARKAGFKVGYIMIESQRRRKSKVGAGLIGELRILRALLNALIQRFF